ncbi:MAG TPA: hypothetical protein HA364_01550 [Thermoplasmata archaeon]|nr:hypothetical protein [Thermoplasmata archaeon]
MRVGDLDERNRVYRLTVVRNCDGRVTEFSGSIVLEQGERVISYTTDFRPMMWRSGWKRDQFKASLFPNTEGMMTFFAPGEGWGTIYFTDRRMLFLRRPDIHQLMEIHNVSKYDMDASVPSNILQRAAAVIAGGGLEFFEIRYEDVVRYDCGLRSADIRVRVVDEEYVLRLPRKVFDKVSPILNERRIDGKKKMLMFCDIPILWMAAASIECLILLASVFSDDGNLRKFWLMMGVLFPLLVLYLLTRTPRLRNVKKKKWGRSKAARTHAVVAFLVAATFLVPGIILTYFHESLVLFVFVMAFVGIFAAYGLIVNREWKIWSRFEKIVLYTYRCPNCGKTVTRDNIACSSCGSCTWWTCSVRIHKPRRKRRLDIFRLAARH